MEILRRHAFSPMIIVVLGIWVNVIWMSTGAAAQGPLRIWHTSSASRAKNECCQEHLGDIWMAPGSASGTPIAQAGQSTAARVANSVAGPYVPQESSNIMSSLRYCLRSLKKCSNPDRVHKKTWKTCKTLCSHSGFRLQGMPMPLGGL